MLEFKLDKQEFFDREKEMFGYTEPTNLRMEHSLISISKWEAIWHKPYLPSPLCDSGPKTFEQELSYLDCMMIRPVPENVLRFLMMSDYKTVVLDYIQNPNSATTIHRLGNQQVRSKTITSELVYYWMLKFGIPFECEKWHFNRLLMLIEVCTVNESKGKKGNKMSHADAAKERARINAMRRANMGL